MQTELTNTDTRERADLLETLVKHRGLLRQTVRGLTDEQAGLRPTASRLCLGGILRHVARTEAGWVDFILEGPTAIGPADEAAYAAHLASFEMGGAGVAALLSAYEDTARRTEEVVASLPTLDASHPLPEAPWFEPGARWSARRGVSPPAWDVAPAAVGRTGVDGPSVDRRRPTGTVNAATPIDIRSGEVMCDVR
jgi:hypothetical protein